MEDELKKLADEVVILEKPSSFYSVGQGYEDFDNLSDEQTTGFIDQWNNEILKKFPEIKTKFRSASNY